MAKYRKKPVVIEAIQLVGHRKDIKEILEFMGQKVKIESQVCNDKFDDYVNIVRENGMTIQTLEGKHQASIGDYIIKGVKGEFYPCKPDIFVMTYDEVK